jgi:hypothetical protein
VPPPTPRRDQSRSLLQTEGPRIKVKVPTCCGRNSLGTELTIPVYFRPRDKRYVGNDDSRHVHDLWNEQVNCEIDEIFRGSHGVTFSPDDLGQAHAHGYNDCYWCIGGSLG